MADTLQNALSNTCPSKISRTSDSVNEPQNDVTIQIGNQDIDTKGQFTFYNCNVNIYQC